MRKLEVCSDAVRVHEVYNQNRILYVHTIKIDKKEVHSRETITRKRYLVSHE